MGVAVGSEGRASNDVSYGGPRWKPESINVEQASPARIYDFVLGGVHNFAVDRQVAEQMLAVNPEIPLTAQANRAFLRRAVQFLVDAGIRQFLDIGSGIPTAGHSHEIAQAAAPDARVVCVDVDPVAVAHSRDVLVGNDRAAAFHEDARRPEQILEAPELQRLIDFEQPVAVLVVAVLHFVPEAEDPADIIARLMAPLASGSYLAMSHVTDEGGLDIPKIQTVTRRAGIDFTARSRQQVQALFGGLDLVEPGVVWIPQWRPESPHDLFRDRPEASGGYAALGRKR